MSPVDLLEVCKSKCIRLTLVNGELRYRAAVGAMTEELKAELKKHKDALIEMLSGEKNYRLVFSRALNREVIISWDGNNPDVVYFDSTRYSVQEIKRLKELAVTAKRIKAIHEIKGFLDGTLIE